MERPRRRPRQCPSCSSRNIARGEEAQGVRIRMNSVRAGEPGADAPAYADICGDCGMVTLYVRVRDVE
jgi:hypothetical protein